MSAKSMSFDAASLSTLEGAFRERSKSISYHAPGWATSRQIEKDGERLNVDAIGHHGQLRLSFWPDGVLYFRLVRGSAKRGWDYALTFYGRWENTSPERGVELFISSLATTDHLSIWGEVAPQVERFESRKS